MARPSPARQNSSGRRSPSSRGGSGLLTPVLILLVTVGVIAAGGAFVWNLITNRLPVSVPPSEQCVATVGDTTASLDLEQSSYAAIIVAEATRRGLPPRAATIGLVTAMQESRLRNLDYGDRDSVGLFQQRPSQGWGTEQQLMDPWYASGRFYAALVKVSNWQTGDINDVAQSVQRSGVPDGYRKHIPAARAFASALTGQSPAAISCVDRGTAPGSTSALTSLLTKAFGTKLTVTTSGKTVRLQSGSSTTVWAATQLAMLTTQHAGVSAVSAGGRAWTNNSQSLATWQHTASPASGAVITVR